MFRSKVEHSLNLLMTKFHCMQLTQHRMAFTRNHQVLKVRVGRQYAAAAVYKTE